MTQWEGENRRKTPRVKYPCLIVLKDKEEQTMPIMVETENISMGGIAVVSKGKINEHGLVDVDLDFGLEEHVFFTGKVVWITQRGKEAEIKPCFFDMGISIEKIDQENFQRMEKLVNHLKNKKHREEFFIVQKPRQRQK